MKDMALLMEYRALLMKDIIVVIAIVSKV